MARMLFLRDIDADVQLRCRDCGHGGVLPRTMLERRFGPNYPVLSIAPHYRCSRCDSRDIESRPILAELPSDSLLAASNDEPSFDAPLAALNGLLASLRGGDDGRGRTADAEEPPPPPPPAPVRGKPVLERPLSDLVADGPAEDGAAPLWEPVSLADMAARLGRPSPPDDWPNDWDDEPATDDARTAANDERPEPARDEVADTGDLDGADSRVADPHDADPDDDGDETLMAMRRLLAQAYGSDDDEDDPAPDPLAGRGKSFAEPPSFDAPLDDGPDPREREQDEDVQDEDEPPVFSHKVLVRRDFEDDGADAGSDPWQLESGDGGQEDDPEDDGPDAEEPSEEEILSFAIRDPEKPVPASAFRPAKPAPLAPAEPLDFDQHRAERRAQRPPPPPEDEEGFDRTLAALRSMIEDAANEPAEEDEDAAPAPAKSQRNAGRAVDKPAHREDADDPAPDRSADDWSPPSGWGDPDPAPQAAAPEQEQEPTPAGRRSAQEREIEEAMKALRGMIEDEIRPDSPPPASQPKPRAAKPRPPARSGSAAPEAGPPPNTKLPDVQAETAKPATPETKPAGEPTPLSKTIAALRGMLELDGRRKR